LLDLQLIERRHRVGTIFTIPGQALSQFQQNNGLQATGRLDRQTMASLLGNNGPGYGSTTPANNANGVNTPPASNAGAGDQTTTPATH
jgi:Putative peptidoglycan binding domain